MSLIYWLGTWPIDSLLLLLAAIVAFFVFVAGPLIELIGPHRLNRINPRYRVKLWRCRKDCERQHRAYRESRERSKAVTW